MKVNQASSYSLQNLQPPGENNCFINAAIGLVNLEFDGFYIEGFIINEQNLLMEHGWIINNQEIIETHITTFSSPPTYISVLYFNGKGMLQHLYATEGRMPIFHYVNAYYSQMEEISNMLQLIRNVDTSW